MKGFIFKKTHRALLCRSRTYDRLITNSAALPLNYTSTLNLILSQSSLNTARSKLPKWSIFPIVTGDCVCCTGVIRNSNRKVVSSTPATEHSDFFRVSPNEHRLIRLFISFTGLSCNNSFSTYLGSHLYN